MTTAIPTFDVRGEISRSEGLVDIPPGVYDFNAPLALPDRPMTIRGAGTGLTELRFHGEGADGVIAIRRPASPFDWKGPITLSDFAITSDAVKGGCPLQVRYPAAAVTLDKALVIDRVHVRPANICPSRPDWWRGGGWGKGIMLENCHGATLTGLIVHGHNGEVGPKELKRATLPVGLDIGGSMCVSVLQPEFMNCWRAIQSINGTYQAEGLNVIGPGFLMNVMVGVWCENTQTDRPVPSLQVRGMHVYAHSHGVVAIGRSSVDISSCELSRHHMSDPDDWFYGLYLDRGDTHRVTGNAFYSGQATPTSAHIGTGLIAVNGANRSTVTGNIFAAGLRDGVELQASTFGWSGSGNTFASRRSVINAGTGNALREV